MDAFNEAEDDGGIAVWVIVVISIAILAVATLLVFFCMRRRNKK